MGERIAVIGAGPMGLAVAYQLARDGHRPILFEADDRVGGMTASFDFEGLQIERYYHFHCVSDHAFFAVLDELGLAPKLRWVETRMGYWFRGKVQAWGNPVALLKFDGLGLLSKLRYGLHAFLSTRRNGWRDLEHLEASRWIRKWVGAEAYEVLWRRLFEYKFHTYANNLSAAWIWSRIRRIGRSRYSLFREKLGYLEGGSSTLLDAMREYIEQHGGEVRVRCPVTMIVSDGSAVQGVKADGVLEPFSRVVSTVPVPYVPAMVPTLPPRLITQYQSITNIAVVCVVAKLRRRVTDNFWLNVNDPEFDIPGIVEYSNLRPLGDKIVYVPFYMPADHSGYAQSDESMIGKVRRCLKKINPALTDDDFLAFHVSRYRYAQPVCEPGFQAKLPPVALPIRGLWVADTSYYYPEDRGISESIGFGRTLAALAGGARMRHSSGR